MENKITATIRAVGKEFVVVVYEDKKASFAMSCNDLPECYDYAMTKGITKQFCEIIK